MQLPLFISYSTHLKGAPSVQDEVRLGFVVLNTKFAFHFLYLYVQIIAPHHGSDPRDRAVRVALVVAVRVAQEGVAGGEGGAEDHRLLDREGHSGRGASGGRTWKNHVAF